MANILIVDNDPGVRKFLERILTNEMHVVWVAPGASEALDVIDENTIDLILMDIYMPEMNGLALMKLIRETQSDIQTILISGRHSPGAEATAKKFGAYGFISKPFCRKDLIAMIHEACVQRLGLQAS